MTSGGWAMTAVGCAGPTTQLAPATRVEHDGEPQQPVILARAGPVALTLAEYKDYLYLILARARVEEVVLDRLLELEAAALGIRIDEAALRAEAAAAGEEELHEHFHGDHQAMRESYAHRGFTPAEREAVDLLHRRRAWLTEAIVKRTREPSAARVEAKFDELYGVDGERVEVRHLFLSFGWFRNELLQQGRAPASITQAEVEALARRQIEALHRRLLGGENLAELIATASHDGAARAEAASAATRSRAGRIDGYNYQHFGVPFAEAVRALQPGQVSGPVKTTSGYHLIALDARIVTRFENVREAVLMAARDEPPSIAEIQALKARLFAKHPLRIFDPPSDGR